MVEQKSLKLLTWVRFLHPLPSYASEAQLDEHRSSKPLGCGFESLQGLQLRGVVQWQNDPLITGKLGVRFLPPRPN